MRRLAGVSVCKGFPSVAKTPEYLARVSGVFRISGFRFSARMSVVYPRLWA